MSNQYANDFTKIVQVYYDDLKKYKPLTKTRERRLLRLSKKGNTKAQNELLEANLKFVFDVAKHYTSRGLPISDLISEGNMGLIKAINKFDESKDVKFISYAVWWIKQSILDAIRRNNLLNVVEIDTCETNNLTLERTISDEEDEIVGKNDKYFSNQSDEENKEVTQEQKEVISKLLNTLSDRERDIIENYYGLGNNKELTLLEIGEKLNLSVERIRQVKLKAIRKLRSSILMYDEAEQLLT